MDMLMKRMITKGLQKAKFSHQWHFLIVFLFAPWLLPQLHREGALELITITITLWKTIPLKHIVEWECRLPHKDNRTFLIQCYGYIRQFYLTDC